MPPTEYPLVSFRIDEQLQKQLENRTSEGAPPHLTAHECLERYFALLDRERRVLVGLFTLPELIVLADAANGTLFEPYSIYFYDHEIEDYFKFGGMYADSVDGASMVERLRGLSPGATWALVDALERFWNIHATPDASGFMSVGLVPGEGV